jgi:Family of unknown function (DUF6049)
VAILLGGSAFALTPPAAGAAAPLTDSAVTVRVANMSPTTATGTVKPAPLTITVDLTNTTGEALHDVQLSAERDAPISRQSQLDQLMAHPAGGDPNGVQPMHTMDLGDLAPHASLRVIYRATTSTLVSGADICLCLTGIYPIGFSVTATGDDGAATQIGFGQTYLPYFQSQPEPVRISWVWPLIDRPHRLEDQFTFTDNTLPASVAAGGRLDRMLRVAEQVAPKVRLSLVVDPDLLDELAVMASGKYDVVVGGKRIAGTDARVAQAWLTRLRALLPGVDLHLTPPSDPDVQAIVRQGLPWSATLSGDAGTRVAAALGVPSLRPFGDVSWPAGGTITTQALSSVVEHGASAVLLDDTSFPADVAATPRPDGMTTVTASGLSAPVRVALTDSAVQKWAGSVLGQGGLGTAALPQLVSELAVRAADQPDQTHYVVITPDRHLDPVVGLATRAILETATTSWSAALPVRAAVRSVAPTDRGALAAVDQGREISAAVVGQAVAAADFAGSFRGALTRSDAATLLGGIPVAVQRTVSSAWRQRRVQGVQTASALTSIVAVLRNGVQIAQPSVGTYTLASNSAPLFVTVVNSLSVPVTVQVNIQTVNNIVGFSAQPLQHETIPARQQVSLRMAVKVQRAGRFQVDATLATPDGTPLGQPVRLQVRSTALGGIGVTITLVATGILVVALVLRFVRRFRHRRPPPPTDAPAPPAQPMAVSS